MRNKLVEKAKKVLLGNKKRGYTLPTNNKLYPAQWKWDSGFISLGYSYFNLKYALDEITTLLRGQWKDGMIPHILFHGIKYEVSYHLSIDPLKGLLFHQVHTLD